MGWLRNLVRTERRSARTVTYTTMRTDAAAYAASVADEHALAVVTACIVSYARAFAAASVEGAPRAVTPAFLAEAVGTMARRGEAFYAVLGAGDAPLLVPAETAEITGGADPDSWQYLLTIAGPNASDTHRLPAAQVLHLRWFTEARRPWRGVGPLQMARRTLDLLSTAEACLRNEANGLSVRLLQLEASGAEEGQDEAMASDLNAPARRSRLSILADTEPNAQRLLDVRPTLDGAMVSAYGELTRQVCAAFGVPPALLLSVTGSGGGIAERESYRRQWALALRPLARLVEDELRAKLERPELTISLEALRAADVAGSTRAAKQLVDVGVPLADALRMVGLTEGER